MMLRKNQNQKKACPEALVESPTHSFKYQYETLQNHIFTALRLWHGTTFHIFSIVIHHPCQYLDFHTVGLFNMLTAVGRQ
jgi:hypothetical protein